MIRPLRQRHRRQILVLGVILPLGLGLGLAGRQSVPAVSALPASLTPASITLGSVAGQSNQLFSKRPVVIRLWNSPAGTGGRAVSFSAAADFINPDLMVYWVAGPAARIETLPPKAILLGAFGAVPLALPDEVIHTPGVLVLYSVADGEVVDVSQHFQFDTFSSANPNPPPASP
ncbi:MAG: hypothetical protein HKL95_09745 [Phycisphaerae bacterium]|jgi:hypothetical protein|nr:hypothetical protein [Phycisphaerae bacterium]